MAARAQLRGPARPRSEAGLDTESDPNLVRLARSWRLVIVTQDQDYLSAAGGNPAFRLQVVWIRTGNTSTENLLRRWDEEWARIRGDIEAGQELVKVL